MLLIKPLLVALSLFFTHSVFATIYKCKAANGRTVYSNKKCAGNAEIFIPRNQPRQVKVKPTKNKRPLKTNGNTPSVDIYITSWCPYCKKAMAFLRANNIAFNAYDIEKDAQARIKKLKLAPEYTAVPLTVINGHILKGYSESSFRRALAQ